MIAYLSGTAQNVNESSLVINTGSVGYLVHVSGHTLMTIHESDLVELYIHTIVREQALDLYGFRQENEKSLFELLITISGIGPKVALSILNATTPETLVQAVTSKDSSVLTKVSGIGKKNAEKIILELENKIDDSWTQSTVTPHQDIEVFEALETLGYRPRDIQDALKEPNIKSLSSTQEIIKAIMRHLS